MKRSTLITLILGTLVLVGVVLLLIFTSGNQRLGKDKTDGTREDVVVQDANVEEIEIAILESFPVQVNVTAYGTLPDGCTELSDITRERNNNIFTVTLTTERSRDAVCTQVLRNFEQTFPLDVEGLSAGEYSVTVNSVQETFRLDVDNTVDFGDAKK